MNIQQGDLRVTAAGDITYRSAPTIRVGQLTKTGFKIAVTCHNTSCPWTSSTPRTTAAEAIVDLVAHLGGQAAPTPPAPLTTSAVPAAKPQPTQKNQAERPAAVRPRRARARVSVPQIFPVGRA